MGWLHAVIDVPAADHAAAADFWSGALEWPAGDPWPDHPELCSFVPPCGTPYVHLQRIDGPARVHIDVEFEDPDAAIERAVALGAELVGEYADWRTLHSPGGLPFCVLPAREHEPPEPVTWPDGHRSRMVQVCVDAPAAAHDREVHFWRVLLGGRWTESSAREFAGKWNDDGDSPLQLLCQRLDDPDGPVRAHLDHGSDDRAAEVRRLVELGAASLGTGRAWHVLEDPIGLPFCVTDNSPERTAR